jgi:sugar/nucleoside kinase (ribokinase family)
MEISIVIAFSHSVSGDRGFIYRPDSLNKLALPSIELDVFDAVLLGECDDRTLDFAMAAQLKGIPCWFLGGWTRQPPEQLLSCCEGVVVSREFVMDWRAGASLVSSFEALIDLGIKLAVITDGSKGGLAWIDGKRLSFGSFSLRAVDTSGAGDAFAAGIVFAALRGFRADRILRFACACAAVNVQTLTASAAPRCAAEVEAFLATEPVGFFVSLDQA